MSDPSRSGGTGANTASSARGADSYYAQPIIKAPHWKAYIPGYFFFGGLAGGATTLAGSARRSGHDALAHRLQLVATGALAVSPILLIKDLGRPRRFVNMLRVAKPTSPMSMGTWILSAASASTGSAAALSATSRLPRVRSVLEAASAALGPPLATYTGALVAQSVVPAWHDARRELPLLFAASSAASASGVGVIVCAPSEAGPARRLGIAAGIAEVAVAAVMNRRLGPLVGQPYREGRAGSYARAARVSALAGSATLAIGGRRRVVAAAGGALLLAGSWCERFAVFHAGRQSAQDPRATSLPQRERATSRAQT